MDGRRCHQFKPLLMVVRLAVIDTPNVCAHACSTQDGRSIDFIIFSLSMDPIKKGVQIERGAMGSTRFDKCTSFPYPRGWGQKSKKQSNKKNPEPRTPSPGFFLQFGCPRPHSPRETRDARTHRVPRFLISSAIDLLLRIDRLMDRWICGWGCVVQSIVACRSDHTHIPQPNPHPCFCLLVAAHPGPCLRLRREAGDVIRSRRASARPVYIMLSPLHYRPPSAPRRALSQPPP